MHLQVLLLFALGIIKGNSVAPLFEGIPALI